MLFGPAAVIADHCAMFYLDHYVVERLFRVVAI